MFNPTAPQTWTTGHFIAYIFMCVAESDLHLGSSELEEVKTRVAHFVDSEEAYLQIIPEVLISIGDHTPGEREVFIKTNKERFLGSGKEKDEVIEGIEEIIMADLSIDVDEMEVYRYVKRALTA